MTRNIDKNPVVTCPGCSVMVRQRSMSKHKWTTYHNAETQHRMNLATGWTDHLNDDTHDVRRSLWLFEVRNRHTKTEPTLYSAQGWGRPSYLTDRLYVRQSLKDLYYSPLITSAEFQMCCNLPEEDPQYQTLWAMAKLGGSNG